MFTNVLSSNYSASTFLKLGKAKDCVPISYDNNTQIVELSAPYVLNTDYDKATQGQAVRDGSKCLSIIATASGMFN